MKGFALFLLFVYGVVSADALTPTVAFYKTGNNAGLLAFSNASDTEIAAAKSQQAVVWTGNDVIDTSVQEPGWKSYASQVKKVRIDSSFHDVQPGSFAYWFCDCSNLQTIDGLNYINTSNAYHMEHMFENCSLLTSLDISAFNTEKVINMDYMFSGCKQLLSLDLSSFNTENVQTMILMFSQCENLTSLNITSFNTEEVFRMQGMFFGCYNLKELDLTSFTTTKLNKTEKMFYHCFSLHTIYTKGTWTISENSDDMFFGCFLLNGAITYDGNKTNGTYANPDTGYFTSKVAAAVFYNDTGQLVFDVIPATTLKLFKKGFVGYFWYGDQVTNTGSNVPGWYSYATKITDVTFSSGFTLARPTSMHGWFQNCYHLSSITNIGNLNTSQVTDMAYLFMNCSELNSVDLSKFDTSKVKDMSCMFAGCNRLTALNVTPFNTSNVTNMASMFSLCRNLSVLDLSNFITSNVTNMATMFSFCSNLSVLELSNFNTSNVTNMDNMFANCSSLTSLNMSNFNTSKVTDMNSMFSSCSSLTSLDVSNFDTSKVTNMQFMFSDCKSLKTIYCESSWISDNSLSMFYNCISLIGAVRFDATRTNASMANPFNGYFTRKTPTVFYDLWLCGTQVTNANYPDLTRISGVSLHADDGYAYYDPNTKTLHLHSATITSGLASPLKNGIDGLTIKVAPSGDSGFSGIGVSALTIEAATTITGGKLTLTGKPGGEFTQGQGILMDTGRAQLTVDDGNLVVYGHYCISGKRYSYVTERGTTEYDYYGRLTVSGNSYVHCEGTVADMGPFRRLTLGEGLSITQPEGASFKFPYVYVNGEVSKQGAGVTIQGSSKPGDVNEDGAVNINDVVAIINVMAGTANWKNANVNGDSGGNVDINDVVAVINVMAGK